MRGKKTSSETKSKVIEQKLNNPDLSSRDIANNIGGVSLDTVCDIINKDLPQVAKQSDVIKKLIDDNNKILNITGDKLLLMLADSEGKIRVEDFIKARTMAFNQNTLAGMTDKDKEKMTITIEM